MPTGVFKRIKGKKYGGFQKGHKSFLTDKSKKKISIANTGKPIGLGRKQSKEQIEKRVSQFRGVKRTLKTRKLMSKKAIERVKKGKHNFGDGSKTPKRLSIYKSLEYRLWRESVFERDNWTCVWCKIRGGELHADHIKPFAYFPELRFAIDNGRTLCKPCHLTTDTWGYRAKIKYKDKKSIY